MTRIISIVIAFALIAIIPLSTQAQDCGLDVDIESGAFAILTPGLPNNIREEPDTSANRLGQIPGNGFFIVLQGPECNDGFTWYEVASPFATGWTVASTDRAIFMEAFEGIYTNALNLEFAFPTDIADDVAVEFVDATDNFPAYRQITFEDYADVSGNSFIEPQVRIFAANAFEDFEGQAADTASVVLPEILTTLEDEIDLTSYLTGEIPEFSPGAAQIAFAHPQYLPNYTGTGYRYIASYAQDFLSVTNEFLEYRYQGFSEDGTYFLDASFPIDAPDSDFPVFDQEAAAEDADFGEARFAEYAIDVREYLEAFDDTSYTPNLRSLDALIASLLVGSIETDE